MNYGLKNIGFLCPERYVGGHLEILLGRRQFLDKRGRPMRFPGEYAFIGGNMSFIDFNSQIRTAKREFREETGYKNDISIKDKEPFFRYDVIDDFQGSDFLFRSHYLRAELEETDPIFEIDLDELIEVKWFSVKEAIELINSPLFDIHQHHMVNSYRLYDELHGKDAISERMKASVTLAVLEKYMNSPSILYRHKDLA